MNYRILFISASILFVSLITVNLVTYSANNIFTGRVDVGFPVCDIFNDASGTRCASVYCFGNQPSGETCYRNDNTTTTRLTDEEDQICEFTNTSNCTISTTLACDPGNLSATYGRSCDVNGTSQYLQLHHM